MISSNALKVKFAMRVLGSKVAAVNLGGQVGFIVGSTSAKEYKQFVEEELASPTLSFTVSTTNSKATSIALWLEEVLSKFDNTIVSLEGDGENTITFRHNDMGKILGGAVAYLLTEDVNFFDPARSPVVDNESTIAKLRELKADSEQEVIGGVLSKTYINYSSIRNALVSCGGNTPAYLNYDNRYKKVSAEIQGEFNPLIESPAGVSLDFVEAVYYLMTERGFDALEITRGNKGSYIIKDVHSDTVIAKLKYIDGDVNAGSFNHIWYNGKIINITKFDFEGLHYNTERLVKTFPLANCPHAREVLASTPKVAK